MNKEGQRIAKWIAAAGLCSRRMAEVWIASGRVKIDGIETRTCGVVVNSPDRILLDDQPLPKQPSVRLWLYHKPREILTTHADPQGRKTVFSQVTDIGERVISVGRLDYNTEGLLLLTNHGSVGRLLEHPKTALERVYRVRVFGKIHAQQLDHLKQGVTIQGTTYGPIFAYVESSSNHKTWLTLKIFEGKNREIRKIIEYLGGKVTRLIRIQYGPFQLGTLPSNTWHEVSSPMAKQFLDSLS